jgi:glycosyltransferase involved in cell wall biosynthesis
MYIYKLLRVLAIQVGLLCFVGVKRMKILHTVEHYPPFLGGMAEVVKQLSEDMVQNGHEVVVATSYHSERTDKNMNGVQVEQFNIKGNGVWGISGEYERYQKFILHNDFEIIVNFAAQQWATDLMLPLLNQIKAKKVIVPTGFSALYNPGYKDYFDFLSQAMHQYDMNIFLSEEYRDIQFAKQSGVDKVCVIPNGASAAEFLKVYEGNIREIIGASQNEFFILLVGSHTGAKGHCEAIEIFNRAAVQNAVLVIVGNLVNEQCVELCKQLTVLFASMPERKADKKRIILAQLSREQTVMAYQAADLFLFPSNIECSPIVLFECMASKTPFLTTDVGNAKEIIKWSGAGKLLPTEKDAMGYSHAKIDESAVLLADVYMNSSMRYEMAEAGFSAWRKDFTWEDIARRYEDVYSAAINGLASVSVIIPTYNRADMIEKSIRSALKQTHSVMEVLVCDDGSTDDTEQIVKAIDDKRVKWIPGGHAGRPACPRNRGLKAAKGEWIAFLDSDDEWIPEKIAVQLALAKQSGFSAVSSNAYRFVPEKGIDGFLLEWTADHIGFTDLLQSNQVICSSAMIHRSVLPVAVGFPEETEMKVLEDYGLWLRVASQTDFAFVAEPLVVYRDAPQTSHRAQENKNAWEQKRIVLNNFLQWAQPKNVRRKYVEIAMQMYYGVLMTIFIEP